MWNRIKPIKETSAKPLPEQNPAKEKTESVKSEKRKLAAKSGKRDCHCLVRGSRFFGRIIALAEGKPSPEMVNIPSVSIVKSAKPKSKPSANKKHLLVPDKWNQTKISLSPNIQMSNSPNIKM